MCLVTTNVFPYLALTHSFVFVHCSEFFRKLILVYRL